MSARALIVDDVPANRRLLEAMLTAEYSVCRWPTTAAKPLEFAIER